MPHLSIQLPRQRSLHLHLKSQVLVISLKNQMRMEERQFRRKWIRDTDSKYIKLAKAGGRKNLLDYKEPPSEKPEEVGYPRVDWFDHYNPEPVDEEGFTPAPPPVEIPRSKRMMPRTEP